MITPFTIDLTINLPEGGRLARQLLNIYFADMPVDVNKTAYSLCEASEALQAQKFTDLTLKRADVWAGKEGSLKVFARFSVSGEEAEFVEKVIADYMEGFPGCLSRASGEYFSHSGISPDISLQPTDWNAEVSKA